VLFARALIAAGALPSTACSTSSNEPSFKCFDNYVPDAQSSFFVDGGTADACAASCAEIGTLASSPCCFGQGGFQCVDVDGGTNCNVACMLGGGRRTAGTRIARAFSRAIVAALAIPSGACTNATTVGANCSPPETTGFFVDASTAPDAGDDGVEDADAIIDPARCYSICLDADPIGTSRCCFGTNYSCARYPEGVNCAIECIGGGGRSSEGTWIATAETPIEHLAFLEAASVPAFVRLREELRRHGAPRSLLRSSSRARRDEIRHARIMRALARRDGARVPSPIVDPISPRPLEAIAIENVIEGCVRETYGALVTTWQSLHARDRELRAAMINIARDETRHAALAWKVHRWIDRRLDRAARARLDDARRTAIATLRTELAIDPDFQSIRDLGLPSSTQAIALLDAITA
jgi:hypothetical protein